MMSVPSQSMSTIFRQAAGLLALSICLSVTHMPNMHTKAMPPSPA